MLCSRTALVNSVGSRSSKSSWRICCEMAFRAPSTISKLAASAFHRSGVGNVGSARKALKKSTKRRSSWRSSFRTPSSGRDGGVVCKDMRDMARRASERLLLLLLLLLLILFLLLLWLLLLLMLFLLLLLLLLLFLLLFRLLFRLLLWSVFWLLFVFFVVDDVLAASVDFSCG